jgi:hypothetical protein
MKSIRLDFVETAERINIWIFVSCTLVCVGMLMPEAVIGPTEEYTRLALLGSGALVILCLMWMTTQTLWLLVRKVVSHREASITV